VVACVYVIQKGPHSQNRVSLLTNCNAIHLQLTNTLQKKLDQVRREKALLEEQIEHEKKAHATLQTQLSGLRDSHLTVAEALEEEEEIEEEA
jgi:predicted  nucleic acid-binding Zn-ribbon protein